MKLLKRNPGNKVSLSKSKQIISIFMLFIITVLTGERNARTQEVVDKGLKTKTENTIQVINKNETYGVCPFVNTNGGKKLAWIADGIAESLSCDMKLANFVVVDRIHVKEIINEIALGQIGLIDEKSAKKPGMMAGADYLVTGSYQIQEKTIRIVSRVIKTETGVVTHIGKVTGSMESIFDLQDNLFESMFSRESNNEFIKAEINKKSTRNQDAYRNYLLCEEFNFKGANLDDPKSRSYLKESIEYGLKAVEIDPKMTIAYLKLSHTYGGLGDTASTGKYIKLAFESISPETDILVKNNVLALYEIRINNNFSKAISNYETVLNHHSSNLEALWQLFAIYRGAFGSTVYDKEKSDKYGDLFLGYYPRSILSEHIKKLKVYDRLY